MSSRLVACRFVGAADRLLARVRFRRSVGFTYAAVHILTPTGLGPGDVALAVLIGFTAGWHDWQLVLIVPLLAHALASLILVCRRVRHGAGQPLPLGTFLAAASLLLLALP